MYKTFVISNCGNYINYKYTYIIKIKYNKRKRRIQQHKKLKIPHLNWMGTSMGNLKVSMCNRINRLVSKFLHKPRIMNKTHKIAFRKTAGRFLIFMAINAEKKIHLIKQNNC